ncbi:MAG: hypothetical protein AAFX93_18015 [Verrucomicrobiota bacterium]
MKIHERVELVLIPCLVAGVYILGQLLPYQLDIGWSFALAALILLVQGFFRDLYLLYRQRTVERDAPKKRMKCMCLESTLGMFGIGLGIFLTLLLPDYSFPISRWGWSLLVGAVMVFGFLTKDIVITWNPFGIRRDPDHMNIVFTLR